MNISRAYRNKLRNSMLWMAALLLLAGCFKPKETPTPEFQPTAALPATQPPQGITAGAVNPTPGSRPAAAIVGATFTPAPDQIWLDQAFGTVRLAVFFYNDPSGARCIRYTISGPGNRSAGKCTTGNPRDFLVAVQNTEIDTSNQEKTIIVGRSLSSQITAVSIEFPNGDPYNLPIDGNGFIVIVPGRRTPVRAVPIDQNGNLVGNIFNFNR